MTKREIERLKKEYQDKCLQLNRVKKHQRHGCQMTVAEAEAERIGCLHAAMALLETGKQQGSSRETIISWEQEIFFDRYANN